MVKQVKLKIDGREISAPEGTMIVDAAKKIGIDIPVFCYHPKMEAVGMCRMCLVEIGRPVIDRTTGEVLREADGSPKLQIGPKLETACTTPISEEMLVITASDKVKDARREVLEFILTSHPLDCPVCDKGGECPLQNLTVGFGSGESRFIYDEKMHLAKHVSLGELIYLDRERCIQCGRCVRFQDEVAGDPVINFYQRGRALEIVTYSKPGFDSIFSGNTTDICPVGALTTADFRFGARPWELNATASICNHCPVGCNITFNVRREAHSGGKNVIKRVMPRQNEAVNEIWICDKGRFAYHYTESSQRLTQPLVRKDGELEEASWDEALDLVANKLREAGPGLVTLAGGRLANEDLYNLNKLISAQGGSKLLYSYMAGGDLVANYGPPAGSNLGDLGMGAATLVIASDLHDEAPVWWLRIKQAAERGATLIVAGGRPTRLDEFASHLIHYHYGDEAATIKSFLPEKSANATEEARSAAQAFAAAENAIILFGSDGLGLTGSQSLVQACVELLVKTGHSGRANNGLIGVWPNGNSQGAWDMGFQPVIDLADKLADAKMALIAAADPAGDDPALAQALHSSGFVVVQELFLTETALLADVVLPVQAFTEREGTYTSGERRVQRFYPAVPALPGPLPDYAIAARLGKLLRLELEDRAASLVMQRLAGEIPGYAGLTYQKLAESSKQWPVIGRQDLYYGGTTYENHQGTGLKLGNVDGNNAKASQAIRQEKPLTKLPKGSLAAYPVTRLFDQGQTILPTELLKQRLATSEMWVAPRVAEENRLTEGDAVQIELNGTQAEVCVRISERVPAGIALLPRSVGLPITGPSALILKVTDNASNVV